MKLLWISGSCIHLLYFQLMIQCLYSDVSASSHITMENFFWYGWKCFFSFVIHGRHGIVGLDTFAMMLEPQLLQCLDHSHKLVWWMNESTSRELGDPRVSYISMSRDGVSFIFCFSSYSGSTEVQGLELQELLWRPYLSNEPLTLHWTSTY